MPICDYCGDEIEFRYLDGRPTPIHVNGGWCTGYGDRRPSETRPFRSFESYVNPNARCPVCGDKVYFYQSPFGGRVFFDDLGWPWPKHRCTDLSQAQKDAVTTIAPGFVRTFRNKRGEALELFELVALVEQGDIVTMKFRRLNEQIVFNASIPLDMLNGVDVTKSDLQRAPSFVVRTYDNYRLLEFISGRKGAIQTLKVGRIRSSQSR